MALQRKNIRELHKRKFHTQKGRNLGDTIEEILSSKTTSKSRFKSDTWPTCHPKRKLLHQISWKDYPTWTLDEGEEMRRDINDLQKKIVTKDELQEMEAKLEAKMDRLKVEIMEVLKNFVTEKTPESENASHEIHDEDTRKVNQEWRNSNFGLKTNHIPKIDMRNFDGKDPITWILQMEQFFDLHNVPHTQKVLIASLYLDPINLYGIDGFVLTNHSSLG
jgi:hypothetical protein